MFNLDVSIGNFFYNLFNDNGFTAMYVIIAGWIGLTMYNSVNEDVR